MPLSAGSVDATVVVPPDNVLLKAKRLSRIVVSRRADEFPSNGYATSDRQLGEKRDLTKRTVRALYRGLFAQQRCEESIQIIEREWKVDNEVARESCASLAKSFSRDGAASEAELRFHIQQIQKMDKIADTIPLQKIVDFRLLEEIRREMLK